MLGALLKQVVGGMGGVPEEIAKAYEDQKKVIGGRALQLSDMMKLLQTTSSEKPTFICIDALDECVAEYRVKLFNSLNQILQKAPGTRIFATGRPHIQDEIGKRLSGRVTAIRITPKRGDIIRYLHNRLDEDTIPDAMDSSLQEEILRKIPEDISEMYVENTLDLGLFIDRYKSRFLLVSLNIDAILQETTIHQRRKKLNTMTDGLGLGDAYGATLSRIKGQGERKAKLGMAALMWISHAERPLKSDELCHALAVEIGSPNLNSDNVPSLGTLLACCQGLVAVDKEASTLRLIHFTLQEFLRAHPELFGAAHSQITETCLSYLNSQQVKALSTSPAPNLQSTPFLEYASLYWGVHAKMELSDSAKLLVRELFDNYNNHISARILLKAQELPLHDVDFNKLALFDGLHCASIFGIDKIVVGLVGVEGCNINRSDCVGNTPLVWAAWNGHKRVVRILLGRDDVTPDKPDVDGQTPLWLAAFMGHEDVVQILLRRDDVNPDQPNRFGKTPLSWAAYGGHEGVVRILLGRDDVNPDKPDMYGATPLSHAARNGQEEVVKMLLARDDVNPNDPDNNGDTPLWWAACDGHEGVMKILLGQGDVGPGKLDICDQSPLWLAACNGDEEVVKMLLERGDANADEGDKEGKTPLMWAASMGHENVIKILLGRDEVNPDKPDHFGGTPLGCAADCGHEGVVKILLGLDCVDPDKPDMNSQTPLFLAASNGHKNVVKVLLGRDDINPNKPNTYDWTPLSFSASIGDVGMVKMLLERDDVNSDKPGRHGKTPLCWAAHNGHEGVVEILLARDGVDPPRPHRHGEALQQASHNGHTEVVKILLRHGVVNPGKPGERGEILA